MTPASGEAPRILTPTAIKEREALVDTLLLKISQRYAKEIRTLLFREMTSGGGCRAAAAVFACILRGPRTRRGAPSRCSRTTRSMRLPKNGKSGMLKQLGNRAASNENLPAVSGRARVIRPEAAPLARKGGPRPFNRTTA
jgi:hypothetical protein